MLRLAVNRSQGRRDGQSLVEFALLIPIFLLLLIAIFDLGRAVFSYNSVTNAAREGARLAIVNQSVASIVLRATSQSAIAETAAPNVTVQFRKVLPSADYTTNPSCTTLALDCVAIVTFETTYSPITPFVSSILFRNGVTLRATSIEQVEFVCPNTTTVAASCPKQP